MQGKVLTVDEIEKLANTTDNPRDKAFILILFESGCRIGELLPLKIGDIRFDTFGIKFFVNGKTGSREIRIIKYQKALKDWLEVHPLKDKQEAFVWITFGDKSRFNLMNYSTVRFLLYNIAKKAGITKPVNPHAFRHASATYFCKQLPEALLKMKFGWVMNSDMPAVYLHLDNKDLDEALLKMHWLKAEEIKEVKQISTKICPKCSEENNILSQFCKKCDFPLDAKAVIELDEIRRRFDEFLFEALKIVAESNPKIKKQFTKLIKEKGIENYLKGIKVIA